MWREVASFELRTQSRQPLLALSAGVFFALGLGLASSEVGASLSEAPGTLRNAPIVLLRLMPVISLLGLFVTTAFVAGAALRDFEQRSERLFFTKPLSKLDYLGGRFVGSMGVSSLVLLAGVLGLMAGGWAPWQPADQVGPFRLAPFAVGTLVLIVPNLLTFGALFFALAIWSRRMTMTYLGVVLFVGLQDALEIAAQQLDNRWLGSLLEPSGLVALETLTQYWTRVEQDTRLPPLDGALLANRLLWLALALGLLAICCARFDFTTRERRRARRRDEGAALEPTTPPGTRPEPTRVHSAESPRRAGARGQSTWVARGRQLVRQTRLEVSEILPRAPFLTLLALGLMFIVAYALLAGMEEGMPSLPLTSLMLQAIGLGVRLTLVLILVLYAGELVVSHRMLHLSEVYDALPIPTWLLLTAKLLALIVLAGVFLLSASLATLMVQLARGFVPQDLGLYPQGLAVLFAPLLPLILLAVFLQVLANHKHLGLLLTVLALALRFALPRMGFENNLYLVGNHPPITYSVFNGYGHHLEPFVNFMAYWGFGALVLFVGALLFWQRGTEGTWRARVDAARQRWSRPVWAGLGLGVVGMAVVGGWIAHNIQGLNPYFDRPRLIQRLADYELAYRGYADLPLPRATELYAEVDVYPTERRVAIRGRYRLENHTGEPLTTLPITLTPRWVEGALPVYGGVHLESLGLPEHRRLVEDPELGFWVVELAEPMAPGAAFDLEFTVGVDHQAFANRRHNDLVVENGTFFSQREFFPVLGYAPSNQLQSPEERRRRGMSGVERTADLDDPQAREKNYLGGDWIAFEAIVSTPADQVAVTAGDLVATWDDGGRRFFHYKTSAPITHLVPFVSGRYAVARETWNGVDLEVYYHPDHAYNIERFLEVTRASLDYLSESFGPYPHDQLRILEIPSYHGKIAFAFSQTIPFSESWTFAADLEAADLDWLAAILAHEVAHQWWNHQVVPADAQGATLIAEGLCQYSASRILERLMGPEQVQHFLHFHRDRYLEQRGQEQIRELPLARVENQAYLHYSKATLAFEALAARIGEPALNQALSAFREDHGFQGPPYATTRDLLGHLRAVTPPADQALIDTLFETITSTDLRLLEVSAEALPSGGYRVDLVASARRTEDDGLGNLTEVLLDGVEGSGANLVFEIAILGEPPPVSEGLETDDPPVLALEHRVFDTTEQRFSIVVDQRPARVVLDPHLRHIERILDDNTRPVEVEEPAL